MKPAFEPKYLNTRVGLKALIVVLHKMFLCMHSNIKIIDRTIFSRESLQSHLENNYEYFKCIFSRVDKNELENQYNNSCYVINQQHIKEYHKKYNKRYRETRKERATQLDMDFSDDMKKTTIQNIETYFPPKGNNFTMKELISIADCVICTSKLNLKLGSNTKRYRHLLLKWFYDNWSLIAPFMAMARLTCKQA